MVGKPLYSDCIFRSAQVLLQVDTFRTIINFSKISWVHVQQLVNGPSESAFPVICLLRRHGNRSTVLLTLYLVKIISGLTSLKQTN